MAALPPGRLDGLLFCVAQGTVVFSISVQAYYWCSMRSAYPAFNIACCPDPRLLVLCGLTSRGLEQLVRKSTMNQGLSVFLMKLHAKRNKGLGPG